MRKFKGVWIDANEINCKYISDKYKEFKELLCINALVDESNIEKINQKIVKFLYKKKLTLLSVDIDSVDSMVTDFFAKKFNPLIIVVEINSAYSKTFYDFAKQPNYDSYDYGEGTTGYGASLERYKEILMKSYNYVYTERSGTNSFFIRNDAFNLIKENLGKPITRFEASQRFHLGNYDPKSGHKYTPPIKKQL